MHSLRHALATRLMEDGTPVEQIADILGHQSVQSTGVYLKSSLRLMPRCWSVTRTYAELGISR
jgi:site-specific recombinase XerD